MSYYITIISLLYVLFFLWFFLLYHSRLLFHCIISLLYHYYTDYFTINSDYIRVSHPNFQELADADSRPMRPAMTDKCPGAAATWKLWGDQASSLCEAKPTYSCEQRLLYALFLGLYLLFWMSVQDLAACNLDLRTAGRHTSILWDVSCHHINKKALLHAMWAQFMPFSFVLYALNHYYILLYLLFGSGVLACPAAPAALGEGG